MKINELKKIIKEEIENNRSYNIFSRYSYKFEENKKRPTKVDNIDFIAKYNVGDIISFEMANPGYGKIWYKITKIDNSGIWGYEFKNTSGIFTPGETE